MSKVTKITLRLNSLMVNNMVSEEAVEANPDIINYAKFALMKQIKDYVISMEENDTALTWTVEEEELPPVEEELDEQQVPAEEV